MFSDIQRRWLVLLAVMLAFLPVVIDMTILHIAVPSLTQALGASATEVLWIIDIYPLLVAGLLVPMGTLADRIGNRRLLLTGLVIFGVSSLLAAFARTGKGALLITEKFAFMQVCRQSRAVYGNERIPRSFAGLVYGLNDIAGQGADIGAPVAADLGFVVNAAQP